MQRPNRRRQFSLLAMFVWLTQAALVAAALASLTSSASSDGLVWLVVCLFVTIACWPWMYGHGG